MEMKTILYLIAITISFSLSKKLSIKQDNVNPGCIKAYSKCNFEGKVFDLCGKQTIKSLIGKQVKSFLIGEDSRVYLYENNLQGKNLFYEEDQSCIKNFEVASLSVGKNGNEENDVPSYCARLWRECDFRENI